jgi:tetratricopeptide (TPR) repeat protein
MKRKIIFSTIFALALAAIAPSAQAQSSAATKSAQSAAMYRAVMKAYDELLQENPKDHEVLFRRASEYYNHSEFLRALDDLDNAVKYAPSSTDKDMMFSIYALRAECYRELKRYSQALPECNKALEIDPNSYPMLNLRAEIYFDMADYASAKTDYNRMRRINSRSQEALFGLAKVAAKENNIGLANEYIDSAVKLTPASSDAYVRRAEVKEQMGDYNGAVDDLLVAMATDSSDKHALPALVKLADSNYAAVMAGLSSAIRQAPRQPLYYFLRASIAAAHFHYGAAIDDFQHIITENLYSYSGLYSSLAECYYALGQYDKALDNIETALATYEEGVDDPAHYFTVRAQIQRAMANYDKALASANRALDLKEDDAEAQVVKALILTDQKKAEDASNLLGEVIINNPDEPMNYLLRAWVLNDFMNQTKAANGFYSRAAGLELDHSERIGSMLGFAQLFNGQTAKGVEWMEHCLSEPDYDGGKHYLGACFYAWAGRTDKALECMEEALKAGYANYHNWTANKDGRVNVEPIRSNAKFQALLSQYSSIFTK